MSKRIPRVRQQRGVAVITALLLTTLAITIVASLFWQQQVQVRSIENQRLQLQKRWILRGAIDWAILILREDQKNSTNDDLTEAWAVPLADTQLDQYVENGRADGEKSEAILSGNIVDAQSFFNLNNLASNGDVNRRDVIVFARLLVNVRLNPQLAEVVATSIAATQAKPAVPGMATPVVTEPSNARPMAIERIEDLLSVPGFTADMLLKLKDFVVVLPRSTHVNANTASAQVLAARIVGITLADATALVAGREKIIFRDAADLASRLATMGKPTTLSSDEIGFNTNYFIVNGKVRINRAALDAQALIERGPFGDYKIIAIHEN